MDRLPTLKNAAALAPLTVAAIVGVGCDESEPAVAPGSRVVAVAAEEPAVEDICEVRPRNRTLQLPGNSEPTTLSQLGGLQWVNVWATWCRPCVEELPLIAEWETQLAAQGIDVDITFVSADSDEEALARFRGSHPDLDLSRRLDDAATVRTWADQMGLDEGAPLPIHVWSKGISVGCARAAAIQADDYEAVRSMLRTL